MSDAWVEGYYKPYNAQTKNLKWQIISAQSDIDKREKKLKTAIKTGKDTKSLQRQLDLLREGLRIATERYDKEVLGKEPSPDKR